MNAAELVKTARRAAGVDQRALAKRGKTSQSQLSLIESGRQSPSFETVSRLLRSAGRQLVAIDTIRADVATIASEIKEALQQDNERRASRLFIQLSDNLAAEHGANRFALTIAEPEPTGSKRWDSALAALAAHWLSEESLPDPDWVGSDERTLKRSWVFASGRVEPDAQSVPSEFRKRSVLIDRATLISV